MLAQWTHWSYKYLLFSWLIGRKVFVKQWELSLSFELFCFLFFKLFSLMDMKPPISRAKMILITKAAIKAIKLYKHVVQIVEKFIKKCKPEYKVPGLYVIDSIVRQSRHQFGTDKDVFGPRFSKNITATFKYLYLCPSEDKSKIVRVLNLWQKKWSVQN